MMTVKIYVSFAADLAAIILMICLLIRLKELSGEKETVKRYFRLFSGIVLTMSVLNFLKSYADLQQGCITPADFGRLSEVEVEAWYWTQMAATFIDIFFSTVFLYIWISFVSLYLYGDRDFIRRKFWIGFAPLIISGVITLASIPMAVMSERGFWFFVVVLTVDLIVQVFYLLICLGLLRNYKKINGYLRFFNPWVFFIPVAAGWLLQDIIDWGFASLGSALGIFLIYISIIDEERYMDPETGFYNMDFAGYLKGLIAKNLYAPCSAMSFTLDSPENMTDFSELLKAQLPEDCEPILRNDHEIVVLTNVRDRGPLTMVIEDVKAVSDVKTGCTLKKKEETAGEFLERVL